MQINLSERSSQVISVNAINSRMRKNGFNPPQLFSELIRGFSTIDTDLPAQNLRLEVTRAAQAELNSIIAKRRI